MKISNQFKHYDYALALAAVGAALGVYLALTRLLGQSLPLFITFYPAIMLVAMIFGLRPGLLATFTAALLVDFIIMPPTWQLSMNTWADAVGLIIFSGTGVLISIIAELYRRLRGGLETTVAERTGLLEQINQQLMQEVAARTQSQEALRKLNAELEQRIAEQVAQIRRDNLTLDQRIAERTLQLRAANETLRTSQLAALNLTEDAVAARRQAEQTQKALAASEQSVRQKLYSILSPEGDIGNLALADILDVPTLQRLMDHFYELSHIPMAIIDLDGKPLVGAGWQDICTQFHRANSQSCKHCIESDLELSSGAEEGTFKLYKCRNNMWDAATPILIGGKKMGNLFTGQFFFDDETPDYELFRAQAKRYGFNEKEYIAALDKVARLSRDTVNRGMEFLHDLASIISQTSYGNIKLARLLEEQKRAEEALRQSQEDLNRAQAVAHSGSWRLDILNGTLAWSDEAYRIFGVPVATDLTYERFLEFIHPDDRDYLDTEWKAALGGAKYDIEHRIIVDGQIKWVREKAELEIGEDGTLLGGFGTVTDITERKQMEEELRQSHDLLEQRVHERTADLDEMVLELQNQVEQRIRAQEIIKAERKRFEDVLEMMPAYAVLLRPDYTVAYANHTFRKWFGDDGGKKCYEFLFNLTEPCENCQTYDVMKTGKSKFWEWTGPNGHNYDVYDYPFTDSDGSPLIMEIGVDVTAHKQAQAALRSASQYARGLLEASLDPLVTISSDGKITDVNKATEQATGMSRDELIGTDFSMYFTEPHKAQTSYQRVFADGFVTDYPLTIRHQDGHLTDVLYNAAVYKNEAGEVQGVFAAARDITEKKAAEKELEKYRLHLEELVKQQTEELARSNKDLEQFAYVASHDLQEPLRAVAGFVGILRNQLECTLNAKQMEYMDFATDGAKRMQLLINGLLEYSRIGRGKTPVPTDSGAVLEQTLLNLQNSIQDSGAKIVVPNPLPTICIDPTQLGQVFQNLVSNALKFRGEKTPEIRISAVRNDTTWQFAVADNGIGIEPQYIDRIFLIFQRLHTRKQYPGTGIGLSICQKIIERHGGRIWVESEPGQGTTFNFAIPDKGERD